MSTDPTSLASAQGFAAGYGGAPLVTAQDLAAGYGGAPVIGDVSFAVAPGDRVALLGPNGGGKTTLFRVILGELSPSAGTLRLDGSVATVPQTDRSRLDFPVTALDVALMGALPRLPWWRRPGRDDRRRALEALDTVALREHAGEPFGELSGGQRQRVLIARALVQDSRLLLLDEPYGGLDATTAERLTALLDRLAQGGHGLMIATHDLEQARGWDLVLCLNRRQIAFGPPAIALNRATIEATYGAAVVDVPGEGGGDDEARAILPPHHHDHP
ncbi:MAG: metal ABC transporter ATP-binding protein [Solirubrobacteraceae bacterium]